jgi:predicted PurR-regulated permease PerM
VGEWSLTEILEVSLVILSFFAPVLIGLLIFYLISVVLIELMKIGSSGGAASEMVMLVSLAAIVLLAYAELKLIRWLRK